MVFKPFALLLALIALLKKGTAVPSPIVPNVALFNLSATITPPSGNNLQFVFQGYGTLRLPQIRADNQEHRITVAMQLP